MSTANPHRAPDGRAKRRVRVGLELGAVTLAFLASYFDHLERRAVRASSIKRYRDVLILFAEHMHPRPVTDAAAEDIDAWMDTRCLSPRTRYHYVSTLHGLFDWAVKYERLDRDPTLTVVRPRFPRSVPRPIPDAELLHALAVAPARERTIMALAAFHGLRAGEIARLGTVRFSV